MQESRLRRYYQQDLKELRELQAERKKEQEEAAKSKTLTAAPNGFEFTNSQSTSDQPAKPSRDLQKADHPPTPLKASPSSVNHRP